MTDHPSPSALLHQLADCAARETLPRFRTPLSVEVKEDVIFDPVTAADREAERAIRDILARERPDDSILGEEHGETIGTSPHRWVIDPVDGTRAFIAGVPMWTTLIGLETNGVPQMGMIDQPFTQERWVNDGSGSTYWHKGESRAARTSSCARLSEAMMMVTDVRAGQYLTAEEAAMVSRLADASRLLRQGLDSYGFGLVAIGHLDLVVEAGLSWYDVAAVIPVIEGAGGIACDWTGAPLRDGFHRGRCIIAANQVLASQAVEHLNT